MNGPFETSPSNIHRRMAAAIARLPGIQAFPVTVQSSLRRSRVFPSSVTCYSSSSSASRKQLVLYSKPGCCLCDGLKEKLHSAFSLSSSDANLHDVNLQIRDITTNPEWERAYQYEIPVLARVRSDGTEEILPRFSPRVGVELIQKKLAAALSQDD